MFMEHVSRASAVVSPRRRSLGIVARTRTTAAEAKRSAVAGGPKASFGFVEGPKRREGLRLQGKQEEERRRHDDRLIRSFTSGSPPILAFEKGGKKTTPKQSGGKSRRWALRFARILGRRRHAPPNLQERIKREEEKRKKEEASEILRSFGARLVSLLSGYAAAGGGAPTTPRREASPRRGGQQRCESCESASAKSHTESQPFSCSLTHSLSLSLSLSFLAGAQESRRGEESRAPEHLEWLGWGVDHAGLQAIQARLAEERKQDEAWRMQNSGSTAIESLEERRKVEEEQQKEAQVG